MEYATTQDLVERFGQDEMIQLTNREIPRGDALDGAVVARAIADAAGDIDARLGGRYPVPLPRVPRIINRIACDLARYYLYENAATEQVTERYKASIKALDGIAKGDIQIGVDDSGKATPSAGGDAKMTSGGRIFGRDDHGFI